MHPALIVGIAFAVVAIVLIIARVLKGRQLEPGSIEETRPDEELDPEAELEEAKGLIEEGETRVARRKLRTLIDLEPERDELWALLAEAYLQDGDPDEAIETYTRCIELGGWKPGMRFARADAHLLAGSPARAIDDYDFLMDKESDLIEAWIGKGRALLRLDRPEPAVELLEEAERHFDGDPRLLRPLAEAYFASGNLDAALECWEEHVERVEADPEVLRAIAETHQMQGNAEAAAEYLRRADEARPEDAMLSEDAAHALLLAGRFADAAEAYAAARASGLDSPAMMLRHGEALVCSGRPEEGFGLLAEVLSLEPTGAADLGARAAALLRLGLPREALAEADALRAEGSRHKMAAALLRLEAYHALGDLAAAHAAYDALDAGRFLTTNVAGRMYLFGMCLGRTPYEPTLEWHDKQLTQRPADRFLHLGRALAHTAREELGEAVAVLDRLLEYRVSDEAALRERSELHRILDQDEAADADVAEADRILSIREAAAQEASRHLRESELTDSSSD